MIELTNCHKSCVTEFNQDCLAALGWGAVNCPVTSTTSTTPVGKLAGRFAAGLAIVPPVADMNFCFPFRTNDGAGKLTLVKSQAAAINRQIHFPPSPYSLSCCPFTVAFVVIDCLVGPQITVE